MATHSPPPWQTPDPAFAQRVRESFARQGFMAHLGAVLREVTPGACEIVLDWRPEWTQQHGYFHGGVVGTLADNAGGYAAFTLMPADASVLTVEYKLNLLAPAQGTRLRAGGQVLRAGRTLTTCRSDVWVLRDGVEQHCATALVTLMTLNGRSDGPAPG